ncbi:MAG TPA: hypothetical protein DCL54_16115 [Alphaproteobacteria bacterium]|nr:hypothetical protein [Alphaproteobacteria bacterium]
MGYAASAFGSLCLMDGVAWSKSGSLARRLTGLGTLEQRQPLWSILALLNRRLRLGRLGMSESTA